MSDLKDMSLASLAAYYSEHGRTPADIVDHVHQRLVDLQEQSPVFITLVPLVDLKQACERAAQMPETARSPVWGAFFAVKDNIDVAGLPTTAACPAFSYTPTANAPTVQALLSGGAICVGKVNMDQFAAGLNGTRSPYGVPLNAVEPKVIPGGSSSGSATVVAAGCVTFALGTDTAGSGRVPAGLQGIVGVKPSVGRLSTRGVVPACASLDCVSVFALSVEDGAEVVKVMANAPADESDHTIRHPFQLDAPVQEVTQFTFAAPTSPVLDFSGPRGPGYAECCNAQLHAATVRLQGLGGTLKEFDFAPLCDVAKMLYESSFVAERYAGIRQFLEQRSDAPGVAAVTEVSTDERLLPVTRAIIGGASRFSAADLYRDLATLQQRRAACARMLAGVDVLLVPTVMHHYLISELQEQESADPPTWSNNAKLGTFTNFVNLLDLCAISIPVSMMTVPGIELRMPFGVTLIAHGGRDAAVWEIAKRFAAL